MTSEHPSAAEEVMKKYKDNGWAVMVPPGKNINDIIAQKGKKMHFVQIIDAKSEQSARYSDVARNTFIQNAFANAAIPVYAHVSFHKSKTTAGRHIINSNVTFEDTNLNSRIVIRKSPEKKNV
jgi:hypothetical protein